MTVQQETAERGAANELPPPLVRFVHHPVRWVRIKIELLAAAVVLAHIGVLIVVALYYLLTQKNASIKHWWDGHVTPADLRHSIRDVSEGVLGGVLAQVIVWNHYAKSHLRAGRTFDRLHKRLHIPEVPLALVLAALFGSAGFLAMYYGLHAFHVHASSTAAQGSVWHRTQVLWNSDWDKKIMGFVAAFVARRPLHNIFDDVQRWFAERRVEAHKGGRFYHPPTFKARVNGIAKTVATTSYEVTTHSTLMNVLMLGGLLVGLGLAGYGYYVLTYVAGATH